MSVTMGAFEAKTHLSELLNRVEAGESVTITKHGRPVAQLVPIVERSIHHDWAQFWNRSDSRAVELTPGSSVKQDLEEGRA